MIKRGILSARSPTTMTLAKFCIIRLVDLPFVSYLNSRRVQLYQLLCSPFHFCFIFVVCSSSFAVDLFSGAGGMSLGMEKYFNVRWVVDNNEQACSTLNSNKKDPNVLIYTEDVKKFLLQSIKGNPCYPKVGDVDHIHASRETKIVIFVQDNTEQLSYLNFFPFSITPSSMQRFFSCQSKWWQKRQAEQ